jgi:hypothetical protein
MPLNQGQLYEEKIKQILRAGNLLPDNLEGNDAGFVKDGIDYFVEVKNANAPDFGQKGLVWDNSLKIWNWRETDIVSQLYDSFGVMNYIDKSFIPRRHSIEPIENINELDRQFDQRSFEKNGIPLSNIALLHEFYARKSCYYIQIENKGLFYLKHDIANLGVPVFSPQLTLRLRAKTHHSFPVHKYSFFAVIQAKIKNLIVSPFDIEEKVGKFPQITK